MKFSLASFFLLVLATALAIGWLADSRRSRTQISSIQLHLSQIESLQLESRVLKSSIGVLEVEIKKLKHLSHGNTDRIPQLVRLQCHKSTQQLRAHSVGAQIDNLLIPETTLNKRADIDILKQEIGDCNQLLVVAENHTKMGPTLRVALEQEIARLTTVADRLAR